MRILLVEDEKRLSSALVKLLQKERYEVDAVYTGTDGLDWALTESYDAMILDVMLPGMDGFEVLRRMREEKVNTPVLMLTARGGVEDRVHGLTAGADYYLPKPFDTAELMACLKTITRRGEVAPRMTLSAGDIELSESEGKLRCTKTGKDIKLGAKEYQLMEYFLRNPGQILPKDLIQERIWGFDSEAEYNNLEVYVSFLRKKLTFVGSEVKIKASRGLGYSLEVN
ncbi:MAG: response regulator transcription factor [Clostridia bacterium]|nr:response regulator transcription factor [Clostridia bacterium]